MNRYTIVGIYDIPSEQLMVGKESCNKMTLNRCTNIIIIIIIIIIMIIIVVVVAEATLFIKEVTLR